MVPYSAVTHTFGICCRTFSLVRHCGWIEVCRLLSQLAQCIGVCAAASTSAIEIRAGMVASGVFFATRAAHWFFLLVYQRRVSEFAAVAALRARPKRQLAAKTTSIIADKQVLVAQGCSVWRPELARTTVLISLLDVCRLMSVVSQRGACASLRTPG